MKSAFALSLLGMAVASAVHADEVLSRTDRLGPSQSDSGGVGLLQMPTARMAREGEFSANWMDNEEYRRYSISLQLLEWLETTIRYTDVRTMPYSAFESFSGDQTYKDKGIDFKFRLLEEGYWRPDLAIGVRDFAGTGLFDSEFIAASKRAGPFDFTLGLAWGNLGERGNIENPFCSLKGSYCHRDDFNGIPGNFEFGNLFHGASSLYGGVEYQTPWQPLRLKLEYDGNDYRHEAAGLIAQDSPFNVGAVYRVFDMLDMHLSYQRGNTLMWGFTLRTNFNDLYQPHLDVAKPAYAPKPAKDLETVDWHAVSMDLHQNAGYQDPVIYADEQQVTVQANQRKYRDAKEGEERAARILANRVPSSVKELRLIDTRRSLPVSEARVDLDGLRRDWTGYPLGQEPVPTVFTHQTPGELNGKELYRQQQDRLAFSWAPELTQSLGGAENFYMYEVGINGNADLKLAEHWLASGTLHLNLLDNYDQFNYVTPPIDGAQVPRVRTHIREYVTSSNLLLTNLQLTAMERLVPDWYGQAYAGYLEMMYAGVGGELLYRPYGRNWALGVDSNYVQQRDWNNPQQLADYQVATGHLSGYWKTPYIKGGLVNVKVGRYLAGDYGVTFNLSKKFDSGIVAGAFATFTDITPSEYGEGSFTKGFYITIPLDLLTVRPSTRTGSISWIPLTRDGGQILGRKFGLYSLTDYE